jgi:hypothetical protein
MFTPKKGVQTPGPRVREIGSWKLLPVPVGVAIKPNELYIDGITVKDAGVVLDFLRLTTSSPIIRREGRTLITESGSRYTLLEPYKDQDPDAYLSISE